MSDVLKIVDLHVSIGDKPILRGVNLEINQWRNPCLDGAQREWQEYSWFGHHGAS